MSDSPSRASTPARRRSRISSGTFLAFGDLHNHSLFSDGAGDPERAFAAMHAAGLDFAALTDHASIPRHEVHLLDPSDYPDTNAFAIAQLPPHSIDASAWARTAQLADEADDPGRFTAIRGFEWTEPWLGHACVWFSRSWLHVTTPGRVEGLHRWLVDEEPEALFGYNHPGREPGSFHDFALTAAVAGRMVSLEAFNRFDDYLFESWHRGRPSPIAACLDAGWRPALVGVSDEHGRSYGVAGKGRTGLWIENLSREGIRRALLARAAFATRESGLLLDATLAGVRMGGSLPLTGRSDLLVDLEQCEVGAGGVTRGRGVELQILVPGARVGEPPRLLARRRGVVGEVTRVEVDCSGVDRPRWLLLRVADPTRPNRAPGPSGHPGNSYALAYASPWYDA